jgi:exodeoxyribonuclease V beta subunit
VLGRNGKDLDGVHDRLAARGIPCAYFKRHGLFATREAEDLLMVLRAVADPSERSHRLKAWLTPFFGLQLAELRGDESLHDDHPLVARLVRLRERCEVRDYAGFARELLHTSGLARRELFVEESARRLTNYQHLVDILLTRAHGRRRTVDELVVDFQALVQGQGGPEVGDDIERVATEGSAVQLLTMHKSKGLEAEVVFVLGGLGSSERPGSEPRVRHVRGTREAWMRPLPAAVAADVTREQSEEDERLFYVALTRARSRLYLPFFGGDAAPGAGYALRPSAAYYRVQEALGGLVGTVPSARPLWIELRDVIVGTGAPAAHEVRPALLGELAATAPRSAPPLPPAPLDAQLFADLRRRHRGPQATSYSRLAGRRARTLTEGAPNEEPKADVHDAPSLTGPAATREVAQAGEGSKLQRAGVPLPGGAATGLFLHEALERVDLHYLAAVSDPAEVLTLAPRGPELRALLGGCAARNGVSAEHVEAAAQVLFHAVRTPLPTREGGALPLVSATRVVREMTFQFPIPEAHHPSLLTPSARQAPEGAAPFRVERGIVRGVVDAVFEHDSAIYFLDWKSDRVEGDLALLRRHVTTHYDLQIKLYTLGVLRLLEVWDEAAYERVFGGHLYAFLRPMALGQPGVVFERPTFADVQRWERELLGMTFGGTLESTAGGAR